MEFSVSGSQEKDDHTGLTRNAFFKATGLAVLGILSGCSGRSTDTYPASENYHTSAFSKSEGTEETVLDLSSNINPWGPAPVALSAMKEQLYRNVSLSGINRYPDFMSLNIRASAAKLNRVSPLNIVPICGISEAVNILSDAYLDEGDEVITTDPAFFLMEQKALLQKASVVKVPLMKDHRTDLDAIIKRISKKTKLIYLMNPHNPCGTIIKDNELENFMTKLAAVNLLRKTKVIAVLDQAYGDYVVDPDYGKTLTGYISFNPMVVLRTASFAYGMAGLRCGYAIARRDIAAEMDGSLLYYINSALNSDAISRITPGHKGWKHPEGNINRLAESGMIAALDHGQDHIRKVRTKNRESLEWLYNELELSGIDFIPSQSNFLLIDLGKRTGVEIKKKLGTMDISVRSGDEFHAGYSNFIRVSIGTKDQMAVFIQALREVLQ
ncbi:MAG TPA: aminotransferase class I/II-fold pyridoxal phosphate-dependent enzyme [Desulfomonilia bacterium]